MVDIAIVLLLLLLMLLLSRYRGVKSTEPIATSAAIRIANDRSWRTSRNRWTRLNWYYPFGNRRRLGHRRRSRSGSDPSTQRDVISLDAVGTWKTSITPDLAMSAREAGLDVAGLALVSQQLGDQSRVVAIDTIGDSRDVNRDAWYNGARHMDETWRWRRERIGGMSTTMCCRRSSYSGVHRSDVGMEYGMEIFTGYRQYRPMSG